MIEILSGKILNAPDSNAAKIKNKEQNPDPDLEKRLNERAAKHFENG